MKELLENKAHLTIKFKNLTSETSVDETVEMISCSINGCSLIVPAKSCVKGHQVHLLIKYGPQLKQKEKGIEVIGKIQELIPVDEKTVEIIIQFNQYIKQEWEGLLNQLDLKQNEVTEMLGKLKSS